MQDGCFWEDIADIRCHAQLSQRGRVWQRPDGVPECLQLAPYITGEFSDVSQEVLDATRAADPHNIYAERTLGMLDAMYRHKKQATVEFLASIVIATTNSTLEWLDGKPASEQQKLVNYAVRRGGILAKENRTRRATLRKEKEHRQILLGQARDEKSRKQMQKVVVEMMKKQSTESHATISRTRRPSQNCSH